MTLNPAWDVFFGLVLLGKSFWYYSEKPKNHGVSLTRQIAFYSGMVLALLIFVGPIAHVSIHKFQFHMVQHISLMMLISPLIVLGSPVRVAVNSKYDSVRRIIKALGSNLQIKQLFRPEIGFVLFLVILLLTHFSPLANAGMINPTVHEFELILFILGGFIYYYPVLEGNPKPFNVPYFTRILSLFAMMLPETMVGFFLYSGNHVLHKLPNNVSKDVGLLQQHTGGAIMWALGMLIDAGWIALSSAEWIKSEKKLVGDE